ncbi:MAG TPA: aspartate/glutamate racemase family protein [Dermatophilaceae bacterium]
MGPAATDHYYRTLIAQMAAAGSELELTMVHADTMTLLANQAADNKDAQVRIYEHPARNLQAAGARRVAVTSIAGHFCIRAFEEVSPLPVIDLLAAVNHQVQSQGHRRVGLLGTRGVMLSQLYGALTDVETVAPEGDVLEAVHEAYVTMAATAHCTDQQREVFLEAGRALVDEAGAEAVMLAGTDLALAFDEINSFPIVDCAAAHVEAIVAAAVQS